MKEKSYYFIFLFCLVATYTMSTNYDVVNLTSNDGLSNSSVNVAYQSSNGLLWFGTWDGLNIYNSRDFKTFKPQLNNSKSISNNIIRDIVEENKNIYWVTTDLGINRFNINSSKFDSYFVDESGQNSFNENSFFISKNSRNQIFAVISNNSVYFYDDKVHNFIPFASIKNLHLKKIFFDLDDNLWLYTSEKKLFKLIFKNKSLNLPVIEKIIQFNHLKKIEAVFNLTKDYFLILSNRQLFGYSILSGKFNKIDIDKKSSFGAIRCLIKKNNIIFIGSEKGLFSVDLTTKKTDLIIPNVSILSLFAGYQDIIWVGTDMQGVLQLSPSINKFSMYSFNNNIGKSAVRTFLIDSKNRLWVGTKGNGIYIYNNQLNENTLKIENHFEQSSGLINNSVFNIVKGFNNEIWIGTDGQGLNYYNPSDKKISALEVPDSLKNGINLSSVYCILPDLNNILWVGTSGYGMCKIEINKNSSPYSIKSFKHYYYKENSNTSLSNNIVYSIIKGNDKCLWIATRGGGLNRFNIENEKFDTYKVNPNDINSITSNDVLSLYKDKKGFLWVGTSMGLNKLIKLENNKPVFIHFSEKEGIPNNTIHGILEDKLNDIWITTNNGVAKLKFENERYRIISYYKRDGLQSNEFSDGAVYANQGNAVFYIGGINGFNVFKPMEITQNNYMPPLWLNAFFIDNNETNIHDYIQKNKLILSYKNKSFSFQFIPLDYLSGSKCEIAYKVEGLNQDWIKLGTSTTVVLSNVPKGNYILKVRCTNANKDWNPQYFSLPLKMTPPWWNSTLSYFVYLILSICLIYGIWIVIHNQIKAKNSVKMKEIEKEKTEEIHEAKLDFFTNIAHEFSNSLTLIYGPCEQLLRFQSSNPSIKKYINIIKSNSERMQTLIQQLLEFRKAETGHLKINLEKIDISELSKYIIDNFQEILEKKRINFSLSLIPDEIYWVTDRDSLEKIIFNLLSNAVKYTPENETIIVEILKLENNLKIRIKNTGVGIDFEYQKSIFDRFEVLNRFEHQISKGLETQNGIGLALCKSLVDVLRGSIELNSDGKNYTEFLVNLPFIETTFIEGTTNSNLYFDEKNLNNNLLLKGIRGEEYLEGKDKLNITNVSEKELVMIIDDDIEIRHLIIDILGKKYPIIEANNGDEALKLVMNQTPAIIICDVIMPIMDGIEFVKVMKSQELTKYIPIILLSTKSSIENQIYGLEIGADGYLSKPFHPTHLEVLIENLLNKNKSLKDFSNSPLAAFEQFEGKMIHKEDKELITKITNIIYENIEKENLTIDFIAKETAISKMQLYRKIKEILNLTPTEYIRSIRLNQAEKLLKTTNKTVSEIMFISGFNNKAYFYREFNKKYNQTPKEYRSSLKI